MNLNVSINNALDNLDSGFRTEALDEFKSIYDAFISNANNSTPAFTSREAYLLSNTMNIMQIELSNYVDMQLLTEFGIRLAIAAEGLRGGRGDDCEHLRAVVLAMMQRGGREVKRTLVQMFKEGQFEPLKLEDGINNYLLVETYFLSMTYYHYTKNVYDSTMLPFYERWGKIVGTTFSSAPFNMDTNEFAELGKRISNAFFKYLSSKYKVNISFN
ncbi:hypothetical protein [Hymenobacter daeguensis]